MENIGRTGQYGMKLTSFMQTLGPIDSNLTHTLKVFLSPPCAAGRARQI